MKKHTKIFSLILTLAFLAALMPISGSVMAENKSSVYVPETGHWIWGAFLDEYNSVEDPLLYFGYPITDDFIDSVTGQHVQYFQKARFDLVDTDQGPKFNWLRWESFLMRRMPNWQILLLMGPPADTSRAAILFVTHSCSSTIRTKAVHILGIRSPRLR
jgi:hypothetical protein